MITRRTALSLMAAVPAAAVLASRASAATPPIYAEDGIAIDGTDPVGYFTEGRPVPGDAAITLDWNGATWRFASTETRAMFEANPDAYAPQYGGYCAFAVANGYTASTDPEAWTIHEDTLYLNFSRRIRRRWERDIPGNIAKGDANWPSVLTS